MVLTGRSAKGISSCLMGIFFGAVLGGCHAVIPHEGEIARDEGTSIVMVIGHRGAAGLAPENTLTAFGRACEIGVDGLELDVLLSSDGVPIVYHDFVLKSEITRNSDGQWLGPNDTRPVGSLTVKQLKQYDVGRLKPDTSYARRYPVQQADDGQRIPTLAEVISFTVSVCSPETRLLIELKTSPEAPELSAVPEEIAGAVVRTLRESRMEQRSMLLSFDWRTLVHVQKIAPRIPTVYLSLLGLRLNNIKPGQPGASPWTAGFDIDEYSGSIARAVKAAGGRFWAPYYKNLTLRDLHEARQLGLKVYVWTPDCPADLLRMIEWGVDGIITNRPDVLISLQR